MIPEIVDLHLEDASFLWSSRAAAVSAPHYLLADLSRLDARVEAHLDGLRVAGGPGWDLIRKGLEAGEPNVVFPAAVLAFATGDGARIADMLGIASARPTATRGVVSALGWLAADDAIGHIRRLLGSDDPAHFRIGIAAAAVHRRNPGPAALESAFATQDSPLRARAFRAVGELGLIDFQLNTRAGLKAKEPLVRYWAAWSTARLNGHADALAHLQRFAEGGGRFAAKAAGMVVRRLPPQEARAWLRRLVKDLGQFRIALIAAGALGDPDAVPFLIEQMKVPAMARVAGEAFSLITGVHVAYEKLERPKPEGFEAGPTEDPEDEDVAMDPDEHLPWPDPALVRKWWADHQGDFAKGTRYLLGHPISEASLLKALKTGYQRQRSAAALELAILHPGRPLFEVRAPGSRQQRLLA